jgi:hypothetical protein
VSSSADPKRVDMRGCWVSTAVPQDYPRAATDAVGWQAVNRRRTPIVDGRIAAEAQPSTTVATQREANFTYEICGADGGSADPLGQGHGDPLRTAHVRRPPDVVIRADVADQPVAVRGPPVDRRLEVVDLEGHVA